MRSKTAPTLEPLDLSDDIDPELREVARSARQYTQQAKERVIQSARASLSNEILQGADPAIAPASAPTRGDEDVGGAAQPTVDFGAEHARASRPELSLRIQVGNEINLIRRGIELARDVVEHPVTWLVMSVVALGALITWIVRVQTLASNRRLRSRISADLKVGIASRYAPGTGQIPAPTRSSRKARRVG
jgi:hypothetical protein